MGWTNGPYVVRNSVRARHSRCFRRTSSRSQWISRISCRTTILQSNGRWAWNYVLVHAKCRANSRASYRWSAEQGFGQISAETPRQNFGLPKGKKPAFRTKMAGLATSANFARLAKLGGPRARILGAFVKLCWALLPIW